jgi:hypothetical protein
MYFLNIRPVSVVLFLAAMAVLNELFQSEKPKLDNVI